MKKAFLFLVLFVFIAHSSVIAMWLPSCADNKNADQIVMQSDMQQLDESNCHEEQEKQPTQHCDQVCLCIFVLANQIPAIDFASLTYIDFSKDRYSISDQAAISRTSPPLFRPPIS